MNNCSKCGEPTPTTYQGTPLCFLCYNGQTDAQHPPAEETITSLKSSLAQCQKELAEARVAADAMAKALEAANKCIETITWESDGQRLVSFLENVDMNDPDCGNVNAVLERLTAALADWKKVKL